MMVGGVGWIWPLLGLRAWGAGAGRAAGSGGMERWGSCVPRVDRVVGWLASHAVLLGRCGRGSHRPRAAGSQGKATERATRHSTAQHSAVQPSRKERPPALQTRCPCPQRTQRGPRSQWWPVPTLHCGAPALPCRTEGCAACFAGAGAGAAHAQRQQAWRGSGSVQAQGGNRTQLQLQRSVSARASDQRPTHLARTSACTSRAPLHPHLYECTKYTRLSSTPASSVDGLACAMSFHPMCGTGRPSVACVRAGRGQGGWHGPALRSCACAHVAVRQCSTEGSAPGGLQEQPCRQRAWSNWVPPPPLGDAALGLEEELFAGSAAWALRALGTQHGCADQTTCQPIPLPCQTRTRGPG